MRTRVRVVVRRLLAAAALGAVAPAGVMMVVLADATPAAAHAQLVSSAPADGSRSLIAPTEIVLTFSEAVTMVEGAVTLLDARGADVAIGAPARDARVVRLALPPLADGGYTVSWRVVSADTHPASGAFTFAVGEGAQLPDAVASSAGAPATTAVRWLGGAARAVQYATLLLVCGSVLVLLSGSVVRPGGAAERSLRRVVARSGAVAVASAFIGIGAQAAAQRGGTLADVWSPGAWGDVVDTRFGHLWLLRAVLATVLTGAIAARGLPSPPRGSPASWGRGVAALLAIGTIGATFLLAGHASSGRAREVAVLATAVHLAAAAVWAGGLVVVAVVARREGAEPARAVARSFSPIALGCVLVVSAAGAALAWRQHALDLDALVHHRFGRLLVGKVLLVATTVVVASRSRATVHRSSGAVPATRLRTLVGVELVLLCGVIGVTAALAHTEPPADAPAPTTFVERREVDGLMIELRVAPTTPGPTTVGVRAVVIDASAVPIADVAVTARAPAAGVGPLRLATHSMGANETMASGVSIPFAGPWEIAVTVRRGEFDQTEVTFTVPFR